MKDFKSLEAKLRVELAERGIKLAAYDTVSSTNAEAKLYAAEAADKAPILFLANEQSAGRGRLGRSFVSRADGGIYMTLLYFTREELTSAVTVTTAAAVAAASSIESVSGQRVGIKWVNDIYNDRGKVAGILVETVPVSDGYAIAVGIGINIGVKEFPRELWGIASSLDDIDESGMAELVLKICEGLLCHAEHHGDRGYMKDYRRLFILQNKTVDIYVSDEHVLRGEVQGVDDYGGLLVLPEGQNEIRAFHSGEITVRLA